VTKQLSTGFSAKRNELLILLLLFLLSFSIGLFHLRSLRKDNQPSLQYIHSLYGPAVMIAYDYGFTQPDLQLLPELYNFLKGNRESFSPELLPETITERPSSVAAYHRYLLYLVGYFWKITGVSWKRFEILIALFLAWYALVLYAFMRLFFGKKLSASLSLLFILSPAVLLILPDLRDFSKAPFILTILFNLFYLLKTRLSWRKLVFISFMTGAMNGIAIGFRQDPLVFMPLGVFITGLIAFRDHRRPRWKAVSAPAVYLIGFLLLGSPMLGRMEGGAQPQHVLIQGFAENRMDLLGMKEAPYKTLLSGSDLYVFSTVQDYAHRKPGLPHNFAFNSSEAQQSGHQWLLDSLFLFPADIAARGWAAVCRILRYADAFPPSFWEPLAFHRAAYGLHRFLGHFFHAAGLPLALIALLILAIRSPGYALVALGCTAYIMGYTSLQTACRHSFHLSFFPLLIAAFLVEQTRGYLTKVWSSKTFVCTIQRKKLLAAIFVLFASFFITLSPLFPLRIYQAQKIAPILNACLQAPLTPIFVSEDERCGWTVFSPTRKHNLSSKTDLQGLYTLLAACFNPELRLWNVRSRYLMAEFDGEMDSPYLLHIYESLIDSCNFSQLMRVPHSRKKGTVIKYFFPAYELFMIDVFEQTPLARNKFTGLALPAAAASCFRGLYEVSVPEEVTHLIQFVAVDDELPRPLYRRLSWYPDLLYYYQEEQSKPNSTLLAEAALRFNQLDKARLFFSSALLVATEPAIQFSALDKLIALGDLEDALEGALRMHVSLEKDKRILIEKLEWIASLGLYQDKIDVSVPAFDALIQLDPEQDAEFRAMKADAFERIAAWEQASAVWLDYLKYHPQDLDCIQKTEILLSSHCSQEQSEAFWETLTREHPGHALFFLHLGKAYDRAEKEEAAIRCFSHAHQLDPANLEISIYAAAANADESATGQSAIDMRHMTLSDAHYKKLAIGRLERSAFYRSQKKEFGKAASLLELAATLADDPESCMLKASHLWIGAGDYERAKDGFTRLLSGSLMQEALSGLVLIAQHQNDLKEKFLFWSQLSDQFPDNSFFKDHCESIRISAARAFLLSGDFIAASDLYNSSGADHLSVADSFLKAVTCFIRIDQDESAALHSFSEKLNPAESLSVFADILRLITVLNNAGLSEKAFILADFFISLLSGADQDYLWLRDLKTLDPAAVQETSTLFQERGGMLLESGKSDEGLSFLQTAASLQQDNSFLWLTLSRACFTLGQKEKAIYFCEKALMADPLSPAASEAAKMLYWSLKIRDDRHWAQWSAENPNNAPAFYYHILNQGLASSAGDALHLLNTNTTKSAAHRDSELVSGILELIEGNPDAGFALITKNTVNSAFLPDVVAFLDETATSFAAAEKFDRAEVLLHAATQLEKENKYYFFRLAELLVQQEKYEEALPYLTGILEEAPDSSKSAVLLDQVFAAQNNQEKQREFWKGLCTKYPDAQVPLEHLRKAEAAPQPLK
jgi:tetratricopeptide (TPR) repeat protein